MTYVWKRGSVYWVYFHPFGCIYSIRGVFLYCLYGYLDNPFFVITASINLITFAFKNMGDQFIVVPGVMDIHVPRTVQSNFLKCYFVLSSYYIITKNFAFILTIYMLGVFFCITNSTRFDILVNCLDI